MANPNKRRGTAWESAIRDYLNWYLGLVDETGAFRNPLSGENIRRAAQEGAKDVGDIHAAPFIIEAKDVKSPAVPTWLRQADVEARHAGFPYGVVVHKVRRAAVWNGRVHMSVRTWTRVRLALGMPAVEFAAAYGWTTSLRGLDTSRWYMTTTVWDLGRLLADYRSTVAGVSGHAAV
ncbi:hypothetical protein [Streptomyces spectabilis]|uniref:Uncharacterized protein n=1 Tax=Streptomyces spectabilis TaxID=68270 RepID=A0A7W8ASR8_STRST|nr:hypothetical protein [Streptomyces spectabilis]MBB5103341.1 hypothetical protein [Streptomyces spectabilis]MCI3902531.1 hypothetical protein [Streptomyces spectabilis]GGV54285.1 hypothetical protein GCM10010245_85800 [Streptomyces spectabilis]